MTGHRTTHRPPAPRKTAPGRAGSAAPQTARQTAKFAPATARLAALQKAARTNPATRRLRALQDQAGYPPRDPPLQRKRALDTQAEEDFQAADFGDESEDIETVADVNTQYEKSLTSGRKLMTEGVKWYSGSQSRKPAVSPKAIHSKVVSHGYKYFWIFSGDGEVTVCMHRDRRIDFMKSGEIASTRQTVKIPVAEDEKDVFTSRTRNAFDDDQSYHYANKYNVKTGEFHASINYKNLDAEQAVIDKRPPPLPNSQIIWFMKCLAVEKYNERHKDAPETGEMTSISREEIGNTRTLCTIFMSDTGRVAFGGGDVTLDEPTDEAIALLGSPNGNSAVWLLIQHEKPGGALDIASVTFGENRLLIRYMR